MATDDDQPPCTARPMPTWGDNCQRNEPAALQPGVVQVIDDAFAGRLSARLHGTTVGRYAPTQVTVPDLKLRRSLVR